MAAMAHRRRKLGAVSGARGMQEVASCPARSVATGLPPGIPHQVAGPAPFSPMPIPIGHNQPGAPLKKRPREKWHVCCLYT